MWSPLNWNIEHPPAKLVSAKAVLNLWTGRIKELAYNMTKSGTNEVVTSVGWYIPTGNVYAVDPRDTHCETNASLPHYCSPEQRARIVGGEACMWGEGTDLSNVFTNLWPSTTMVAERLWSGPAPQGGLDLLYGDKRRLRKQRCRLVAAGLPVASVGNGIYDPDVRCLTPVCLFRKGAGLN
jgi:hypothetical protein